MPHCPGCERVVPYEQLDVHQQYCRELVGDEEIEISALRRLEERVAELDAALDERISDLEVQLDRQEADGDLEGQPSTRGGQQYQQ